MFCPGRMGDSAGSKVTQQLMGAENSCLEIGSGGSVGCHQRFIWQRQKWKIWSIKIRYFFKYYDVNHYIIHPTTPGLTIKFVDLRLQNTRYRSCLDPANQQIFVHMWGPIVMGPYNTTRKKHDKQIRFLDLPNKFHKSPSWGSYGGLF